MYICYKLYIFSLIGSKMLHNGRTAAHKHHFGQIQIIMVCLYDTINFLCVGLQTVFYDVLILLSLIHI